MFECSHRAITNPCPCFLGVPVVVDASVRRRLSFPVPKPPLTFCLLDQELCLFGSQVHRNPHRHSRPLTVSMSSSIIQLHTRYADALPWLTPMLYALKMHATNTSTRRSSSVMHHHLSASCVVPD